MASSDIASTLPITLQIVCGLVMPRAPGWNNTITGPTNNQSTSPSPSPIIPSGYIAHPDIGAAYKVYNESVTWKVARGNCISEGARLAVIDSYLKLEYLIKQAPSVNAAHVGLHHMYDGAEWVSATSGSTIPTPPWAPGNPTGAFDCVLAGHTPRGLRNLACTTKANYVCELPVN